MHRVKAQKWKLWNFRSCRRQCATVFARRQSLHEKVAMGMENLKMRSLYWCNKCTVRYGPANNLVLCTASRPKNGNLGIFEAVEDNGTVFAPIQCLHQKVAMGTENLKCNPFLGAINALGVTARQITQFHARHKGPKTEIWEFSKLLKTKVPSLHQGNVYIKGSYGYGEPKNAITFSVH